jgi:heptaprenyl diphosphate synthase
LSIKTTRIGLLVAMATILSALETSIPNPMPWIRLGLANLATILALKWWGMREAFLIVALRVFLSSLILGRLFQITFWLSFSGSIAACLGMWLIFRFFKKFFSLIGISIFGAVCHNLTQIFVAYFLFVHHTTLFSLIPLLLLSSLFSGLIIGIVAHIVSIRTETLVH